MAKADPRIKMAAAAQLDRHHDFDKLYRELCRRYTQIRLRKLLAKARREIKDERREQQLAAV